MRRGLSHTTEEQWHFRKQRTEFTKKIEWPERQEEKQKGELSGHLQKVFQKGWNKQVVNAMKMSSKMGTDQ